jgi:hypothetical protein
MRQPQLELKTLATFSEFSVTQLGQPIVRAVRSP